MTGPGDGEDSAEARTVEWVTDPPGCARGRENERFDGKGLRNICDGNITRRKCKDVENKTRRL